MLLRVAGYRPCLSDRVLLLCVAGYRLCLSDRVLLLYVAGYRPCLSDRVLLLCVAGYVTNMHKSDNALILIHCPETLANVTMMSE